MIAAATPPVPLPLLSMLKLLYESTVVSYGHRR